MKIDVAVIGGGIVGLSVAHHLTRRWPDLTTVVLEKESEVSLHQTGRNSGVIHSGIYYRPGSLKAENCREGRKALVSFCREHDVPHEICGKVIVAADASEREGLYAILERGRQNGIQAELIGPDRLAEREPHVRGVEAILVPEAGIVDYVGVARTLARLATDRGAEVRTGHELVDLEPDADSVRLKVRVRSNGQQTETELAARFVVNCAGLYADRVARMSGQDPGLQVVPFRGEYFELTPTAARLCRHLIYPVPDPAYPFLGVHFTRMHDGSVECGPTAIVGFAREGYTLGTVNLSEAWEILRYRGFQRLALRHWRKGMLEIRQAVSKRYYLSTLRRLVPEIELADLVPRPAGVRAQALRPDGTMVDDFDIQEAPRIVNVCNAASPAATACLNVGRLIVERLATRF